MPRLKTDNIERDRGRANREAIRLPSGCHKPATSYFSLTPGVISTTAHGLAGSPSDDEISGRWCDLRRHPARRGGGGGSGGSGGGFGTERLLLDSEEENDDGEDEDEAEEEEEVVEEEEEAAEVRLELPAMSRQPRVIGERELSRDLRESRDPRDHRDSRDSDHIVRTKYRDQDYNYETHNSATPVTAVTASSGHTANPKDPKDWNTESKTANDGWSTVWPTANKEFMLLVTWYDFLRS
ncbi:hypothetical protein PV328_005766 [Microctonus aethiopoides]|uniref:Uncharacterized protein n=1 Tax=Microctonus aethiopoides TaxID=144406 RepID=A0AA39KSS0_9HYME|nr:hypothetical protein PV328_005766 [Microctonus aethiopoides]